MKIKTAEHRVRPVIDSAASLKAAYYTNGSVYEHLITKTTVDSWTKTFISLCHMCHCANNDLHNKYFFYDSCVAGIFCFSVTYVENCVRVFFYSWQLTVVFSERVDVYLQDSERFFVVYFFKVFDLRQLVISTSRIVIASVFFRNYIRFTVYIV